MEFTPGFVAFSQLSCQDCKVAVHIYYFGVSVEGRIALEGVCPDCGKEAKAACSFDNLLENSQQALLQELLKPRKECGL